MINDPSLIKTFISENDVSGAGLAYAKYRLYMLLPKSERPTLEQSETLLTMFNNVKI